MDENQIQSPPGRDQFLKGCNYLKGIGQAKDEGMAAASFLDSSDLNYPEGVFASALIYFCGIGVTRSTQTASEFAQQYLNNFPEQKYSKSCGEIINGSMGTQNALKVLHELDKNQPKKPLSSTLNLSTSTVTQIEVAKSNKNMLFILLAAGVLILGGGIFFLLPKAGGNMTLPTPRDPVTLFTPEELMDAKRKALEKAGVIRTEARTAASSDIKKDN